MEKFIAVCLWAVQLLQNHTWKNMDFEKDKKKKKRRSQLHYTLWVDRDPTSYFIYNPRVPY